MKKNLKIYVASSWRNTFQGEAVDILTLNNFEVYDFKNPEPEDTGFHWSEIDENWKGWHTEQFVQALEHPVAVKGFLSDWDAMHWADVCVLVLPCGRSAHLEAGYFVGAGKYLYIWQPISQEPELMYRMATGVHDRISAITRRLVALRKALS